MAMYIENVQFAHEIFWNHYMYKQKTNSDVRHPGLQGERGFEPRQGLVIVS